MLTGVLLPVGNPAESGFGHRLGLVDEHDRDAVTYREEQTAGPADNFIAGGIQFHGPLALRAGQNIEQFFLDHGVIFSGLKARAPLWCVRCRLLDGLWPRRCGPYSCHSALTAILYRDGDKG